MYEENNMCMEKRVHVWRKDRMYEENNACMKKRMFEENSNACMHEMRLFQNPLSHSRQYTNELELGKRGRYENRTTTIGVGHQCLRVRY